jgi:hypothetical protein
MDVSAGGVSTGGVSTVTAALLCTDWLTTTGFGWRFEGRTTAGFFGLATTDDEDAAGVGDALTVTWSPAGVCGAAA